MHEELKSAILGECAATNRSFEDLCSTLGFSPLAIKVLLLDGANTRELQKTIKHNKDLFELYSDAAANKEAQKAKGAKKSWTEYFQDGLWKCMLGRLIEVSLNAQGIGISGESFTDINLLSPQFLQMRRRVIFAYDGFSMSGELCMGETNNRCKLWVQILDDIPTGGYLVGGDAVKDIIGSDALTTPRKIEGLGEEIKEILKAQETGDAATPEQLEEEAEQTVDEAEALPKETETAETTSSDEEEAAEEAESEAPEEETEDWSYTEIDDGGFV